MPKLVWLDTGLVNYAAQVQKEVLGAKDIMDAWRGMIAEQIVAQELLTLTDKVSQKRCFWVRNKSGSNAEVDYVWVQDSMVYPIEVKSGHNAHLRSLHSFMPVIPMPIAAPDFCRMAAAMAAAVSALTAVYCSMIAGSTPSTSAFTVLL